VNFNASSSSGPDGSILVYAWSFGDGGTGTGETITHTYTNPGIYTAELTVTDDDGNMDSTSCTITVTAAVGTPPSARFTATPSSGEVPLAVNFNASASSDPDGSITSYAWSFGDGGTSSGVTASHTYNSAGAYTAQLTVTDDDGGIDSTSIVIVVMTVVEPPTGTEIGGTIGTDAIWRQEDSPYVATTDVRVPAGVNLDIEFGTTILFHPGVRMQIEGTITANGTPSAPIVFTRYGEAGSWAGVEFLGTGTGSVLDSCVFQFAFIALDLKGGVNIPAMTHLTIEQCSYGVYSTYGYSSAAIQLSHCLITGADSAIMLRISGAGSLTVTDCTITENRVGVRCNYSFGPVYVNYNNIYGNTACNVEGANVLGLGEEVTVDATSNWWGTTDTSSIDAGIYDKNDDLGYGSVTYLPNLDAPHPSAPAP